MSHRGNCHDEAREESLFRMVKMKRYALTSHRVSTEGRPVQVERLKTRFSVS